MEEVNEKIDWEQRRYEIAKDFLTATCRRVYLDESSAEYYSKKKYLLRR